MGSARPASQADPACEYQAFLGSALCPYRPHEKPRIHTRRSQFRSACGRQGRQHPADVAKSGGRGSGRRKRDAGRDCRPAVIRNTPKQLFRLNERHSFDAVSVWIADKCGVVTFAMCGPQARSTIARTSSPERGGMESIDELGRSRTETDMRAAFRRKRSKPGAKI